MVCKNCGQFSSTQYCYPCSQSDGFIDYCIHAGSGTISNPFTCGSSGVFSHTWNDITQWVNDIDWTVYEDKKKCTCLTSDLMIKGCTCGGS